MGSYLPSNVHRKIPDKPEWLIIPNNRMGLMSKLQDTVLVASKPVEEELSWERPKLQLEVLCSDSHIPYPKMCASRVTVGLTGRQ